MSGRKKEKNISKKNSELWVNTLIIVGIVFLIGSLVLMFTKKKDENRIVEISYNEYIDIINEDKYNIILLTSPTCSHCLSYKPYVNYAANEKDLKIYNINLETLEYTQYVAIHDSYSATKERYNGESPSIPTPVTIITKNGEEVVSTLGDIGYEGFLNLLKSNKVID